MNEEWRDIVGFEGQYQISSLGRIKSLARTVFRRNNVPQKRKERIMSPATDKKGYSRICLMKNNIKYTRKVHRLVCEAFIPNPKNLPQVNHKNAIKSDNRLENLEWCDNSFNQKHAFKNGLNVAREGVNHYSSKIKEQDVIDIRRMYKNKEYSQYELADMYNMNQRAIWGIVNYKSYKNIE